LRQQESLALKTVRRFSPPQAGKANSIADQSLSANCNASNKTQSRFRERETSESRLSPLGKAAAAITASVSPFAWVREIPKIRPERSLRPSPPVTVRLRLALRSPPGLRPRPNQAPVMKLEMVAPQPAMAKLPRPSVA
jgi:hypothetical protein